MGETSPPPGLTSTEVDGPQPAKAGKDSAMKGTRGRPTLAAGSTQVSKLEGHLRGSTSKRCIVLFVSIADTRKLVGFCQRSPSASGRNKNLAGIPTRFRRQLAECNRLGCGWQFSGWQSLCYQEVHRSLLKVQ